MKVAHLVSSGGFFGAEKVLLQITSHMNQKGVVPYAVVIYNRHNPHLELAEIARAKGISTFVIESNGQFDISTIARLLHFLRENHISILHTHNYKSNIIGLLAARQAKIPIVATIHGYIGTNRKLKLYEAFDRFILKFFDKIIFVDDSLTKWFKNGSVKYELINNGVKVTELTEPKSRNLSSEFNKNELVIGTVGRLSEEKGQKFLIEAFARLVQTQPHIRLLLVGDGPSRNQLESLCKSLGITDRVMFTGYQQDVDSYYEYMDIYVSPSLIEHFPLAVMEAMSFEKPIVATNVGGTSDLIKTGETGILIEPASSEEIYQALLQYLHELSLREACGKNAQKFVKENYSVEKMINEYRQVYEEVL